MHLANRLAEYAAKSAIRTARRGDRSRSAPSTDRFARLCAGSIRCRRAVGRTPRRRRASTASREPAFSAAATRPVPHLAAFCNGILFRYLDYNDTYLSLEPAHPSDNFAAVLAAAEAAGAGGKEIITAAVLAYEIQCRLCDAASIRKHGWDHVTYGAFSTAAAAAQAAQAQCRANHAGAQPGRYAERHAPTDAGGRTFGMERAAPSPTRRATASLPPCSRPKDSPGPRRSSRARWDSSNRSPDRSRCRNSAARRAATTS